VGAGRWSILRAERADEETRHEALARQYIRRYGVVFRDLLAREAQAPAWRDLVRVYRRLEMSGELRGGRLVAGFVGEQFAAPEAVDALRATRREERKGEQVRVSACDPLNLVGIITPGARIPAALTNTVVYRDGVPIQASDSGRAAVTTGDWPSAPPPA
jgi:ATP-dependent Lhr-like helicase